MNRMMYFNTLKLLGILVVEIWNTKRKLKLSNKSNVMNATLSNKPLQKTIYTCNCQCLSKLVIHLSSILLSNNYMITHVLNAFVMMLKKFNVCLLLMMFY